MAFRVDSSSLIIPASRYVRYKPITPLHIAPGAQSAPEYQRWQQTSPTPLIILAIRPAIIDRQRIQKACGTMDKPVWLPDDDSQLNDTRRESRRLLPERTVSRTSSLTGNNCRYDHNAPSLPINTVTDDSLALSGRPAK